MCLLFASLSLVPLCDLPPSNLATIPFPNLQHGDFVSSANTCSHTAGEAAAPRQALPHSVAHHRAHRGPGTRDPLGSDPGPNVGGVSTGEILRCSMCFWFAQVCTRNGGDRKPKRKRPLGRALLTHGDMEVHSTCEGKKPRSAILPR